MADGAALAIVMQTSNLGEQQIRQQTKEELLRRHGGSINDISVDGEWVDADHYRVVVRADIPLLVASCHPGAYRRDHNRG